MSEREIVSGLINSNNTVFNAIIRTMANHKLLDRAVVRQIILDCAEEIRLDATQRAEPGVARYDLIQFENLAQLLADDEPPARWRPVVIQGGKDGP